MAYAYIYILANKPYGTVYIGITNDLSRRIYEHKNNAIKGFTSRYDLHKLVYYEPFDDIQDALRREKNLKAWKRDWKIKLVSEFNPEWENLYEKLAA